MQTRFKFPAIFLALSLITLFIFSGCSKRSSENQTLDSSGRPVISAGERALAMLEVQNTFSKHAYYHQVGKHCEEIEDLWVKIDGEFSKTATWNLGGNVMEGMKDINYNYCTVKTENKKQKLESLSNIYPAVKNIPENLGAGDEYVIHTQETPVIEVAGDGNTAKGIWYSIGLSVNGEVSANGQTNVRTGWMWEKYAVDFVKEDGKWKIWHLYSKMDQGPSESGGQGQGAGGPPAGGQAPGGAPGSGQGPQVAGEPGGAPTGGQLAGGSGGMRYARQVEVPRWSPTTAPIIDPRFPEPYYTFSETFSY
ncbi:MAG: nuclear transport factor 2 family protein [Deltaproteobacteria bacterium]|nr:nuclear transport factor 2 family protein [Deltaproteobacteria bacterium]